MSAIHTPAPGRHRTPLQRLVPLTIVVAVLLAPGCIWGEEHQGPTRDDFLPVVDLGYPGAREDRESFSEAVKGTTVDGAALDRPASVKTSYVTPVHVPRSTIFAFYRERLTADGWTDDDTSNESNFSMTRPVGDALHGIKVYSADEVPKYDVHYSIRETQS